MAAPAVEPVVTQLVEPLLRVNPVVVADCRYGRMAFLSTDQYIGTSLLRYGEYSEAEVRRLCALVQPGDVVIDAGANIGALTLPLARAVGPSGAVFAFEPQPFIYYLLCANVALNGLQHVVCHRLALSHEVGVTMIRELDYTHPGNFGGFRVYEDHGAQVPTNVSTIDAWRLNRCTLLKVDVEGMERMVLRGAYATLRRLKPVLWVECEPAQFTSHLELLQWISVKLGYRVERVTTPLYEPGNWRSDQENVFPGIETHNLLCLPR